MRYVSLIKILHELISQARTYSMFHQILGVAFFQFGQSLFKIFEQNVLLIIFHLPPTSLKIWWNFDVYFQS